MQHKKDPYITMIKSASFLFLLDRFCKTSIGTFVKLA